MPFCDKIIRSLKANSAYAEIRAAVKFYEKCRRPLGKRTVRLENILQLIFFIKISFFLKKERVKFRNAPVLRGSRDYRIKIYAYFCCALIKRAGGIAFVLKARLMFRIIKKIAIKRRKKSVSGGIIFILLHITEKNISAFREDGINFYFYECANAGGEIFPLIAAFFRRGGRYPVF